MTDERKYSVQEVERIIQASERLNCILNFMLSDGASKSYLQWLAARPDLAAPADSNVTVNVTVSGAPNDDKVRELVRQGIAEANESSRRGGYGTYVIWETRKG